MRMVFAPLNAGANVTARFTVKTEPLTEAELLPTLIAHELLCRVEALPSTWEFHAVPASFSKYTRFVARS
jgi:hypothetical protein